ncbi:MAG TPA: hypothetical protein VJQ43_05465 [Thermoplasmata archaeon]|nr:hypothetical protein [Thermoplasmata archaeon]
MGVGSGVVGAAAIFAKGSSAGLFRLVPAIPSSFGALALPLVSLLALVGPTGLTFPCWAHEPSSPGMRLIRWVHGRFAA